ncbi:9262_t:CDS:1 [Dentiscutata heterogama]|uniref:9262_t:CDS:1 n=1 Tax=Dentiscutata heterogama TaxID=1316150 RepID=A0ACA9KH76_9GLOM|nr:9262_t:CDS:1 [Dentiscutata heterogama]
MICNCWRKTGILLEDFLSKLFLYKELDQANEPDITDNIQELIIQLLLDQPMDAQEYVIADNNLITTEIPTDEKIIEAVKNCDCIESEEESQCKPILLAEVLRFICRILTFLEQQSDSSFNVDDSFIQDLEKLQKKVNLKHVASKY